MMTRFGGYEAIKVAHDGYEKEEAPAVRWEPKLRDVLLTDQNAREKSITRNWLWIFCRATSVDWYEATKKNASRSPRSVSKIREELEELEDAEEQGNKILALDGRSAYVYGAFVSAQLCTKPEKQSTFSYMEQSEEITQSYLQVLDKHVDSLHKSKTALESVVNELLSSPEQSTESQEFVAELRADIADTDSKIAEWTAIKEKGIASLTAEENQKLSL
jgi:hypothetical protein